MISMSIATGRRHHTGICDIEKTVTMLLTGHGGHSRPTLLGKRLIDMMWMESGQDIRAG